MKPRAASRTRLGAFLPALLLTLAAGDGCGGAPQKPDLQAKFDADKAWSHLETLVSYGERCAGSPGIAKTRTFLADELKALGLSPVLETFEAQTPAGKTEFTNVYADLPGKSGEGETFAGPLLLLATHFDTKRFDVPGAPKLKKPFVGANDAGSGTAVLLELARVLTEASKANGGHERGYRFLFLDGEESMRWQWQDPDNTYGSKHHARQLVETGLKERVEALVLLDMVGDKSLKLTKETNSDPTLLKVFFDAADELELSRHVHGRAMAIQDDHIRFKEVGIRVVDLIDFHFGTGNRYWHSAGDTIANCSKESLQAIGRITLRGLRNLPLPEASTK